MREASTRERSRIWTWVRLLLVILAFVIVWRGTTRVRERNASLRCFVVDPDLCRVSAAPAWLTGEDLAEIRRDAGLSGQTFSFFSSGLGSRFARAYERSPWVERVSAVHLRYPNRVAVDLELRTPMAGILSEEGDIFLVDSSGRRLPGERRRPPPGLPRLMRLIGVTAPPSAPGAVWSAPVAEGAGVAADLHTLPDDMDRAAAVLSIDVGNVGGRLDGAAPEVTLVSASGAIIEWGRSSLSSLGDLDPSRERKFLHLRRALRLHPGLEGLERVKLQFDDLVVVERPSALADGRR